MPKVSQEYMDKKREMIVEAAYKVCLRKPVQMVNITDVIAETGMSQGAIYRYYASLDDILIDLVSKMRADYNIVDRLNEITSDPEAPFEKKPRIGSSKLVRKQYGKLDNFIQALIREKLKQNQGL